MPNKGDNRCRLEHALKTRTTLSSEFSSDLRGRNLALTCGTKKEVKTWYFKQQLAVKDIDACKVRMLGGRHHSIQHFSRDFDLDELTALKNEKNAPFHKNTDVLLLERQLARQREIYKFNRQSFRRINVYDIDKKTGEIVQTLEALPVESMFPDLAISARERQAMTTDDAVFNSHRSANGKNETVALITSRPATDDKSTEDGQGRQGNFITSLDALSRQRARGLDKADLLDTKPKDQPRSMARLSKRMNRFLDVLKKDMVESQTNNK